MAGSTQHGPLTRYTKVWVAHAPIMLGTFSPPPRVSYSDMHHSTCVTHVQWCMPGSLTSCFLWSQWWGKRSRHSRRMRNPQFCLSGKRSMEITALSDWIGYKFTDTMRHVNWACHTGGHYWNCYPAGALFLSQVTAIYLNIGCSKMSSAGAQSPNEAEIWMRERQCYQDGSPDNGWRAIVKCK